MKIGKMGAMNIDFSEHYDPEDDIYYVTFKTGEPSYCREIDDVLLLEVGIFTGYPTGFRILNFHKNQVGAVHVGSLSRLIKKLRETLDSVQKERPSLESREAQVEQALEKVFA